MVFIEFIVLAIKGIAWETNNVSCGKMDKGILC